MSGFLLIVDTKPDLFTTRHFRNRIMDRRRDALTRHRLETRYPRDPMHPFGPRTPFEATYEGEKYPQEVLEHIRSFM